MDTSIDQIIGFIMTVFAMVFLLIKSGRERKPEPNEPTAKKLRDFLESLDEEMKEIVPIKPAKQPRQAQPVLVKAPVKTQPQKPKPMFESNYEDPYGKRSKVLDLGSQADAPSYDVIGKAGNSRASGLVSGLKSKKQMVILNEIMSPPKSMR